MAFKFFQKSQDAPARKASAVAPVLAYGSTGRVAWSSRDVVSLTRAGFIRNPVGFRAVKLVAEAAAALPLIYQDRERRYEDHPAMRLLSMPNPMQGCTEFFEALYGQLILSGDAYIEAVGGENLPQELYVLRSNRMAIIPGHDGWPVAYEYSVGARKHRFTNIEGSRPICHIKSFHPQNDHYGLSPLQAAATAIDVHNSAAAWAKALLDNAARPSGAIVFKGSDSGSSLTAEQYDRLLAELEANHQGARNAGRPLLLEGGLDWKQMGFSPSDMEFQKTRNSAARDIAMAFGVPPMLIGIPGDATYANYQEANRAFYRLTILPLVGRVLNGLSVWLSGHSGDSFSLRVDLDQVPALSAERDNQWQRVANADFLSSDEKRTLLGFAPAKVPS